MVRLNLADVNVTKYSQRSGGKHGEDPMTIKDSFYRPSDANQLNVGMGKARFINKSQSTNYEQWPTKK